MAVVCLEDWIPYPWKTLFIYPVSKHLLNTCLVPWHFVPDTGDSVSIETQFRVSRLLQTKCGGGEGANNM